MNDLDRLYDALSDAVDNGELSEQEARDEWLWAKEQFWKEVNDLYLDRD